MDLIKIISGDILLPFNFWMKSWGKRFAYTRFLNDREICSLKDNVAIQKDKLSSLLSYAIQEIPYYHFLKQEINFPVTRENCMEVLSRFPLLTKDIIRANQESLHKFTGNKYIYNTSGGSTGEPVRLIQDHKFLIEDCTLYSDGLAGYSPGDKVVYLWGSELEFQAANKRIRSRISNEWVYRRKFLNTFKMSEERMAFYITEINRFKPKIIIAYVQSIVELSDYIRNNRLKVFSPESIIVSAGTLYEHFRESVQNVFQAPVFNRYGSREVGNIAMECEKHEGLHVHMFNHVVEILDNEGNQVREGDTGELAITLLTNYTMPLIRYKIGDIAEYTGRECSCGRGLPIIRSVKGRTVNIFRNKAGDRIDGEYFTHLFYGIDFIKKFQVIQWNIDTVEVKIVSRQELRMETKENFMIKIRDRVQLVMGRDCQVKFTFPEDIEPLPSGKYVYTLSKL